MAHMPKSLANNPGVKPELEPQNPNDIETIKFRLSSDLHNSAMSYVHLETYTCIYSDTQMHPHIDTEKQ